MSFPIVVNWNWNPISQFQGDNHDTLIPFFSGVFSHNDNLLKRCTVSFENKICSLGRQDGETSCFIWYSSISDRFHLGRSVIISLVGWHPLQACKPQATSSSKCRCHAVVYYVQPRCLDLVLCHTCLYVEILIMSTFVSLQLLVVNILSMILYFTSIIILTNDILGSTIAGYTVSL